MLLLIKLQQLYSTSLIQSVKLLEVGLYWRELLHERAIQSFPSLAPAGLPVIVLLHYISVRTIS